MASVTDYYQVLGVSSNATTEQIRSAYHSLAKQFHPDRHANEGDEELQGYAQRMSLISEAYEVLSEPTSRQRYDRLGAAGWAAESDPVFNVRAPNASECMFCAHSPIAHATLRRNVGMVFMRRHATFTIRACRGCGLQLAREMQNSTLMLGWLGVISFFANIGAVLGNAAAIWRFSRLDDPVAPSDRVARPVAEPAYQGRSIFARPGIYVACVVLLVLGSAIGNRTTSSNSYVATPSAGAAGSSSVSGITGLAGASGTTGATGASSHSWALYDCVAGNGTYITGVVDCSQPNVGWIVGFEPDSQSCPPLTTTYFTESSTDPSPGTVVCIAPYGG